MLQSYFERAVFRRKIIEAQGQSPALEWSEGVRCGLADGVQLHGVNGARRKVDGIGSILAEPRYVRSVQERGADEGQKHATDGLLKTKGCTGQVVGKHPLRFLTEMAIATLSRANFAPRKVNLRQ